MKTSSFKCDICCSKDYSIVYKSTLYNPLSKSDFSVFGSFGEYPQIVRCNTCDLQLAYPRDDWKDLKEKYKELSSEEYLSEEESRRETAKKDVKFIKKYFQKGENLDVGCSAGIFLSELGGDFKKHGVELSVKAVEIAKKIVPEAVIYNMPLEEVPIKKQQFHIITMWDVIEHMDSPASTLKHIHSILRNDGRLIIMTPNIGSLFAKLMRKRWPHLIRSHLYYFTPKTLNKILLKAGFKVIYSSTYTRYFRLYYLLARAGITKKNMLLKYKWPFSQRIPINFGDATLVVAEKLE